MPESCLSDFASREIIWRMRMCSRRAFIPLDDAVKEGSETLNAVEAVSGILQYRVGSIVTTDRRHYLSPRIPHTKRLFHQRCGTHGPLEKPNASRRLFIDSYSASSVALFPYGVVMWVVPELPKWSVSPL